MADGRRLINRDEVITSPAVIRFADAKSHADDDEMVRIGTGNRNPIWRPIIFRDRK